MATPQPVPTEDVIKQSNKVVITLAAGLLIMVTLFAVLSVVVVKTVTEKSDTTACLIRRSIEPWKGLKTSFKQPPTDQVARDEASKQIVRGINRAQHAQEFCQR